MPFKNRSKYVTELKDLMVDLQEAVETQDEEQIQHIVDQSRAILSDIEEAGSDNDNNE